MSLLKKIILAICLFSIVQLSLAADEQGSELAAPAKKDFPKIDGERPLLSKRVQLIRKTSLAVVNDKLAKLYVLNGKVIFNLGDKETALDDVPGVQNLWLESNGKYVYALWWVKFVYSKGSNEPTGGKRLFIRVSDDYGKSFKERAIINSEGGVLPEIDLEYDDAGNIAIIYQDERGGGYKAYFNYSNDGGATWLKKDLRLDFAETPEKENAEVESEQQNKKIMNVAHTPRIMVVGGRLVAFWQQLTLEDGKQFVSFMARYSNDFGKSWQPKKEIARHDSSVNPEVGIFSVGDEGFLTISSLKGLIVYSTRDGSAWENLGIATGTEQHKVTSVVTGAGNDKVVLFAYTAVPQREIWRVEVVRFDRVKREWLPDVYRVDRRKKDQTYSKSAFQALRALPDGNFAMVWEDYRNIIPSIYLDYSNDNGKSWTSADRPNYITIPGYAHSSGVGIEVSQDKLWVYYSQLIPILKTRAEATVQALDYNKDGVIFPDIAIDKINDAEKEQLLRQRVKEFWKLRVEGKWEDTWAYHDPVYQLRMDKHQWLGMQGKIKFFDFSLNEEDGVSIFEPYASVSGKFKYTNTQMVVEEGLKEPEPPKESNFDMRWGWFYDNWYYVPQGILSGDHLS